MTNGIHTDVTIKEYHANRTHISATQIKRARKSLSEWKWYESHEQESKAHFDFGNAFELALLDKVGFEKEVAIEQTEAWEAAALISNPELKEPGMSKVYKELCDGFRIAHRGKYIIPDIGEQSFMTIEKMLESCIKDSTIQKLISGTEYQLSLFWTHEETGLNLKTRPDICKRKKNVVVNLKTINDGSPKEFSRELAKYDYPIQAAVEIMGCLRTGLMTTVDNYFWLVVEKKPPFNATIYEFDKTDIMWAMDELEFILSRIKKAKDADLFPGYSDRADNEHGILKADIPLYYKTILS